MKNLSLNLKESPITNNHWWKDQSLCLGLFITVGLAIIAALAPNLIQSDPSLLGDVSEQLMPPSTDHFLGTDLLGRDIFARLIHGSRVSLFVGWIAVLVSVLLGTAVGLLAGLGPNRIDRALMSITDLFLAFPRIFLILLLVSLTNPSLPLVMTVLGLTGWMPVARLVRAEALALKESDFVAAAQGLGLPAVRVALIHVLPNLLPTVVVAASLRVGGAILAESFLSYLGLGAQEPTVSWGAMIQSGRAHLLDGWWLTTFPGLAIALTVIGYNILGEALRDRLDSGSANRGESR